MGDTARILVLAPFTAAAIAADTWFAWWPLPFPRALDEIDAEPARLLELLTQPSRGLIAPLSLPPGTVLTGVRRRGGPEQEPDKHRTTGLVELLFRADGAEHSTRVVVKLQSGRGMPLYIQAIRAVVERGFSREIEFYRQIAPVVPVRVARPFFADAVTFVNRVCLVVEHVESTTPADWRGCSLEAMRALLASAARLNAGFLGRLSTPATGWIPARAGLDYATFVTGFIAKTEPWYRDAWEALQRYFAPRPVTLAHGDCRPGNMLFTGEGQVHAAAGSETEAAPWPEAAAPLPGVVMSDWEAVNVAPLLWDFTYATIIGLRIGDRDAWLDRLLDEFLASLQAAGVPPSELDRPMCRLEIDLLALVLAYISLVVFEHRLWSGQGNTGEDQRAWGGRVRHAALAGDAAAMAAVLGLPEDTMGRVRDRLDGGLSEIGR